MGIGVPEPPRQRGTKPSFHAKSRILNGINPLTPATKCSKIGTVPDHAVPAESPLEARSGAGRRIEGEVPLCHYSTGRRIAYGFELADDAVEIHIYENI